MSFTLAAAQYADAVRLYRHGDLHHARDTAEDALLTLSSTGQHRRDTRPSAPPRGAATVARAPATRGVAGCDVRARHRLFGDCLLLLSSVYVAVHEYAEAERLLVTCDGYWHEHLSHANGSGDGHGTAAATAVGGDARGAAAAPSRVSPSGVVVDLACTELCEGLATVAYNRAVLRLEQLQQQRRGVPHAASTAGDHRHHHHHHYELVVAPLIDVCGYRPRASDDSSVAVAASHSGTPTTGADAAVRAEVLELLHAAQRYLAHTVGRPRRLLADVQHTLGVCHYEAGNYVTALEAWQRSLAIRVHLRAMHQRAGKGTASGTEAVAGAFSVHRDGHPTPDRRDDSGCCDEAGPALEEVAAEELKVALTMEHVAHVYRAIQGRELAALKLLDAVTDTRRTHLGPAHPLVLRTLFAKAVLAAELGRVTLARALLERCGALCRDAQPSSAAAAAVVGVEPALHAAECTLAQVEAWQRYMDADAPPSSAHCTAP